MHINQISVFLENRTGGLAEVTRMLAANNINLRALSIAETADYGVLRLITDDSERASAALLANGNILSVNPVMAVAVPDKPAGLNELLEILAEGDIAIEYMYSLLTQQNGTAYMVFRISDEDKFVKLLGEHNMKPVCPNELNIK